VVLQTFQPEHYAIQAASVTIPPVSMRVSLKERRKLGYPPFSRLVRLEYRSLEQQRPKRKRGGWQSACQGYCHGCTDAKRI